MPLRVEVVSQERRLFEDDACDMVVIPGIDGELGILPRHTPLLTTMKFGELRIRKGNAVENFVIYGGVAEVRPDRVTVMADAADFAAEVNIEEAQAARDRAAELLRTGLPEDEQVYYLGELRRAELAINIARKTQSGAGSVRIISIQDDED